MFLIYQEEEGDAKTILVKQTMEAVLKHVHTQTKKLYVRAKPTSLLDLMARNVFLVS